MSENNKCEDVCIIGISGASCTGKTSIAQLLRTDLDGINSTPNGTGISQAHKYEVEVYGHDNYYRDHDWPGHEWDAELNWPNYETVNALDTDRMLKDLRKIIEDARARPFPRVPKVIIVEGIFVFTFPGLSQLCDRRYFFTGSFDVLAERRRHRKYRRVEPAAYFKKYVWPVYIQAKEYLEKHPELDIQYFSSDAEIPLETLHIRVRNDISNFLNKFFVEKRIQASTSVNTSEQ